MDQKELLKNLWLPDGSKYSLSNAWAARSGSGKTTLMTVLVNQAVRMEVFKNTRFIYISVKGEHLWDEKTVVSTSVEDLFKSVSKNQISVFYPMEPEYYEEDIDQIINGLFNNVGGEVNFHLIIDDANVLKGFDNRGVPSSQVKKLAIAGRSKGIRGTFILHRVGNLPRLLNGNLSHLVMLNISSMDSEYSRKVFGMNFDDLLSELDDYKWAVVDLITEQTHKFAPVSPANGS